MNTLTQAITAMGGPAAFAAQLGITRQAAYKWMSDGYAPPQRAVEIARITGLPARDMVDEATRSLALEIAGL